MKKMKFDGMEPEDRLNLILDDIASMIEAYNMQNGEVAAIFLAFAAKDTMHGGQDFKTFMEWAKDAWTSESYKELQVAMKLQGKAVVRHIKNNGLFKSGR